jgi:hypothetical protein
LRAMDVEFKDHVQHSKKFAFNQDLIDLKNHVYPILDDFKRKMD